ncbi:MAG: hypothetical protein ACRDX9_09605 [Acidimicrobiia bacterium]
MGALLAVPIARRAALSISAVTGVITGSLLLMAALYSAATVVF